MPKLGKTEKWKKDLDKLTSKFKHHIKLEIFFEIGKKLGKISSGNEKYKFSEKEILKVLKEVCEIN